MSKFTPTQLLRAYRQNEDAPATMLQEMGEFPLNQIISTYAVTPITLLANPFHVRNVKAQAAAGGGYQKTFKKDDRFTPKPRKMSDDEDGFAVAVDAKKVRKEEAIHRKTHKFVPEEEEAAAAAVEVKEEEADPFADTEVTKVEEMVAEVKVEEDPFADAEPKKEEEKVAEVQKPQVQKQPKLSKAQRSKQQKLAREQEQSEKLYAEEKAKQKEKLDALNAPVEKVVKKAEPVVVAAPVAVEVVAVPEEVVEAKTTPKKPTGPRPKGTKRFKKIAMEEPEQKEEDLSEHQKKKIEAAKRKVEEVEAAKIAQEVAEKKAKEAERKNWEKT